ncbi:neutrophil cytosol factor 2-like [Montipora foliosa]|uniref:neutrophil cytosol factor 2-like n=1 Tax=Montipora foliosa TaxID=591990 RepID=UPI0035F10A37
MAEMSMVETLTIWNDGVSLMDQGKFQDALMNFIALEGRTDSSQQLITSGRNLFNIGQTYLALGDFEKAAESFQSSVEKDKMMAVAHFMLGNVNLALNRNQQALQNFNDANFYLRGNKLINYQQLGLKFKLYLCEITANRAIAHSRLGDVQEARDDFLMAMQSKVEPRHSIIDDSLLCWQSGKNVEPLMVPSHAVFQPQKKNIAAIQEKRDFLGQSKVLAINEVAKFPESRPRTPTPSRKSSANEKPAEEKKAEEHLPEAKEAASGRMALLQDLRKKETRKSLKRVSVPLEPPTKSLPHPPERPSSPRRPPPEPRAALTLPARTGAQSRSPMAQRKKISLPVTGLELNPPNKPLPPAPKSKSPVPPRRISAPAYLSNARDVSLQLILTRAVKVDSEASAEDLVRAAADTFNMPEGSFALWYKRNGQLLELRDRDLEEILDSPANERETIYCYANNAE